MPKNNLTVLLDRARCAGLDDGMEIGMQFALDLAVVALADRYGFGAKRITEFITAFQQNYDAYKGAFRVKEPDADYIREKLDAKLKAVIGGSEELPPETVTEGQRYKFAPFEKRYPKIKEIKY